MATLKDLSVAFSKIRNSVEHMGIVQLEIMLFVSCEPGCNQDRMVQALNAKRSTVSRAIGVMMKDGLILNEIDPAHRSHRLVYLTPKGQRVIKPLQEIFPGGK